MLSTGHIIWSADEGGEYKTTRSLSLNFSSKQESTYISTMPEIKSVISDLSDLTPFVRQSFILRAQFDEARLTYLTVSRHIREGRSVYYSYEEEPHTWYELLFKILVKSAQDSEEDL